MSVELRGAVKRIVFSNEETAFCVLRVLVDAKSGHLREEAAVVGVFPGIREGYTIAAEGKWETQTKFGKQFRSERFRVIPPTTRGGIEKYLASGVIPGVGKVMAQRLVEAFGVKALDVIEHEPHRLKEVSGVGMRRAKDIRKGWENQQGIQEVMVFLSSHGISPALSARIYREYGAEAVSVIRENPYRLADEVFGVGFQRADSIAKEVGIASDSPLRAGAALLFVLGSAVSDGHTYLPREQLIERCSALLGSDPDLVERVIPTLEKAGRIVREDLLEGGEAIFPFRLYEAEVDLAEGLGRLSQKVQIPSETEISEWMGHVESELKIEMSVEQKSAVQASMAHRFVVITGGPGTGKTTLVRAIYQGFIRQGLRIALCAPTGRAARRLGEATGGIAKTIHRLLEYSPRVQGFERSADNPLNADAIIVDEVSMMDIPLAEALIQAAPEGARLVLVGDADQLPPVGPGSFLRDLIESQVGKVVRLNEVFRQGKESLIVTNAHHINQGAMPSMEKGNAKGDFFFIQREDSEDVLSTLRTVIMERIPKAFGFSSRDDIQVLTPMVRGDLGAKNLNNALQGWLNPQGVELTRGDRVFRLGDKVMQVRNNYEKEVFNGDVGVITGVESALKELQVRFDDRELSYKSENLDELRLAYAITVHKSQGSEYPVVVLPLHGQHFMMLRRNLLYTAVTRGKSLVVIVGSKRSLKMAVERDDMNHRYSRLLDRLTKR